MAKPWKLSILLLSSLLILTTSSEPVFDLVASESVAKSYKAQSVESGANAKYGYPYRIAPTLTPNIQARSDDDDENVAARVAVPTAKTYGSRISTTSNDAAEPKKAHPKKVKTPYVAARRQDEESATPEKQYFRSYKEPKYRNFDELEADFLPRRMDVNIPYSQYEYRRPAKPAVSPIDPYLTPSADPGDIFYPVPKIKTYPSSSPYSHDSPTYGAGRYEDPIRYGTYGGPSSSYPSSGGPSSYPSSGGPSSYTSNGGPSSYPNRGQYDYQDNYSIKSNEPIIGNIRKKLLDYAGASDLYEGEPDYLRQISRNKYKYGNLGNDYYSYGGPVHKDSYRDFPYVESKITLIKKSRGL